MLRVGLAGFTGFHPPIVRDKGAPARAGHDPVFRHLLGVPGPTPSIDRSAGGVKAAAVADDQGLPLVFDATADERTHGVTLQWVVMLTGLLKAYSITILPIIRNTAPAVSLVPFHLKNT